MYIYMYVYVTKYKYGHICTTCMTLNTCKVTRVIHTFMYNSGVESSMRNNNSDNYDNNYKLQCSA